MSSTASLRFTDYKLTEGNGGVWDSKNLETMEERTQQQQYVLHTFPNFLTFF